MKSIRAKITVITIIAILTSVLSAVLVTIFTVRTEYDRSAVEIMNLICQNAMTSTEKYLSDMEQAVEMTGAVARDSLDSVILVENGIETPISERTTEQTAVLDDYLKQYCSRIQQTFASIASQTGGVVSYYYCIAPEVSENEHGFFYSRVGKTGFAEREPLDAGELDPDDLKHTAWYYTPIVRGRPGWVGPYTAHLLDELQTYSYLVPIYKVGLLIGVLGMDIPFSTITEQVREINVYKTGYACLLDSEGRVYYHPELPYNSTLQEVDPDVDISVLAHKSSGSELIEYKASGQKRLMAFDSLSNGMKLLVTASKSEIIAPWTRLMQLIVIATVAIIAVFSFLILMVMGVITRPLKDLTSASRRLADGDYSVQLTYKSRDEVGALTAAFIKMRDNMQRYIEDLNRRVYSDELTGLPNMRHFFQSVEKERKRMRESGKQPVILYFNLIGMRFYNRQYGFREGDKLICEVAKLLAAHFGTDRTSRFGRDHFAALTEENGLVEELETILRECSELNGGNSLPIRIGIYLDRMDDVRPSSACDRAKYACYQHPGSYISEYFFFNDSMLRHVQNTRYIINNLDKALDEKWIKVYYQPIIRAATGRICDEEALARWVDPVKGMISPGEFIPILEHAMLIYKVDLYVLDEILAKMKAAKRAGLGIVPHSLNLSRVDFDTCDIVREVTERVDASGIPRDMLTIEVTESMIGGDFDYMKEQIRRFQSLGFQVWMDDFGSGYSSLDVLQDIHFDLIKFDMRFIQRFDEGEESKVILRDLLKMTCDLGLETITEGVETLEAAEFLREAGCTKLQGFYFSKPIPLDEILARHRDGTLLEYEKVDTL